jgi:hypothetical protein
VTTRIYFRPFVWSFSIGWRHVLDRNEHIDHMLAAGDRTSNVRSLIHLSFCVFYILCTLSLSVAGDIGWP